MEERTWCKYGIKGKKKGKLYLLACLLFCTVNILLLCKKIATRKNKKQEKYRILTEIFIQSKTPWWLLIRLILLLFLVSTLNGNIILWYFWVTTWPTGHLPAELTVVDCSALNTKQVVTFSIVHIFSHKWAHKRRNSHAALVIWIQ